MAQQPSNQLPMPGYVIYRPTQPGKPVDLTGPLVFMPPKDSDELFDALRAKFPNTKSHSERMRDATIEFLIEERQNEQTAQAAAAFPNPEDGSPWQQAWPSASTSNLSSPETSMAMTPMFGNSPKASLQPPKLSRQSTVASAGSAEVSPPALENMTNVFCLTSAEQPKQRVRRKMTEAEKIEYRKRRIVKACDKCSKRKRKCIHNQPEVDHVTAAKPQKITKPAPASNGKRPAIEITTPPTKSEPPLHIRNDLDFSEDWVNDMQPIQDFTTLLDPEYPGLEAFQPTDPFAAVDNDLADWQWPTSDFTLMDNFDVDLESAGLFFSGGSDSSSGSSQQSPSFEMTPTTPRSSQQQQQVSPLQLNGTSPFTEGMVWEWEPSKSNDNKQRPQGNGNEPASASLSTDNANANANANAIANANGSGNVVLWEHLRTGQQQSNGGLQQLTEQASTLPLSPGSQLINSSSSSAASRQDSPLREPYMHWHDLVAYQPDNSPRHTLHTHDPATNGDLMHNSDSAGNSPGEMLPQGRISSKSKILSGGLPRGLTQGQVTQLGENANEAKPQRSAALTTGSNGHGEKDNVNLLPISTHRDEASLAPQPSSPLTSSFKEEHYMESLSTNRSPRRTESPSDGEGQQLSAPIAGPLEVMQIRDYLRMKTNMSNIEKSPSNAHPLSIIERELLQGTPPSLDSLHGQDQRRPSGLAINPAPGNSRGMMSLGSLSSAARQGSSGLSLGGTTLDGTHGPSSTDLFMLRRGLTVQSQQQLQAFLQRIESDNNAQTNSLLIAITGFSPAGPLEKTSQQLKQQQKLGLGEEQRLIVTPRTNKCAFREIINSPAVHNGFAKTSAAVATQGSFANFFETCLALAALSCVCWGVSYQVQNSSFAVAPLFMLLALLYPVASATSHVSGSGSLQRISSRLVQASSSLLGGCKDKAVARQEDGAFSWRKALASAILA